MHKASIVLKQVHDEITLEVDYHGGFDNLSEVHLMAHAIATAVAEQAGIPLTSISSDVTQEPIQ